MFSSTRPLSLYLVQWTIPLEVLHAFSSALCSVSSTLAWKISWMEEPGGLQSMGWLGVGHDWATSLSLFTFMHWRKKWQPTPVFLPGESQRWGSLVAAVYGVIQSRPRLKWLSSSMLIFEPTINKKWRIEHSSTHSY